MCPPILTWLSHSPIMKEETLDFHEKRNHRDHHLYFDIQCIASKTAGNPFFTDFSFIFSFDFELLDPGFHKGRFFLKMLSSISLDLSVSLSLIKEFILPLSNWLNVVQRSFHCWISYVFRYKWDQVCAFPFKWVTKLFHSRNQRANMTYEARLTSRGLLMMWCASLVSAVLLCCRLKLFYHSCQLRSSHHPS